MIMEPLHIKEGQSTPNVSLNNKTGKLEFTGNSLPEDAVGFYAPVFNWIEDYVKLPAPETEVNIRLSYFNSSSSKAILDMLTMLESIAISGQKIEVIWHYLDLDEDMLSTGKEFEAMLKIPFSFLTYLQE